jgi:Flp pilus assembly protein TadG
MDRSRDINRRGAVAPFAAVLAAILVGMVAFAVDVGWIVLTKSQLQNAADAAVLAGIDSLMDGFLQHSLTKNADQQNQIVTTTLASARTRAKQYAGYNDAGGVSQLGLRDEDIEFGFTDVGGTYTPMPAYTGYPNTIKVLMRRDEQANGALKLFFAPVLGRYSTELTATAAGTAMAGSLDSFATNAPRDVSLLPVTYDVEHWNNYLKTGADPDGDITLTTDGVAQLQVYPSVKYEGNFGLLALDDAHTGASEVSGWISDGLSTASIATLENNGLIPLSSRTGDAWDWRGENGFKSSVVQEINDHVGEVYALPLFKAYASGSNYEAGVGQGSHFDFNIVQFVGVKIMPGDYNREVIVLPAAYIDPFATYTDVAPMGTHSTLMTTFTTPKLTR